MRVPTLNLPRSAHIFLRNLFLEEAFCSWHNEWQFRFTASSAWRITVDISFNFSQNEMFPNVLRLLRTWSFNSFTWTKSLDEKTPQVRFECLARRFLEVNEWQDLLLYLSMTRSNQSDERSETVLLFPSDFFGGTKHLQLHLHPSAFGENGVEHLIGKPKN